MFREPDEAAVDQAAAKLDRLAATRRSTIRRESSLRPGRTPLSRSLIDRIRDRREQADEPRNSSLSSRQPRDDTERDIHELDADLGRLRSVRMRQRARANQLERDMARRPDNNSNDNNNLLDLMQRIETDVDLLTTLRPTSANVSSANDTNLDSRIEIFSSDTLNTIARHLPRPSRESGLRFEVAAPASQPYSEQSRRTRLRTAGTTRVPSPSARRRLGTVRSSLAPANQGPTGLDDDVEVDVDVETADNATLTPGFAPARGPFGTATVDLLGAGRSSRTGRDMLDGFVDTAPPETFESASYPPLRRVNHASPRPVIGSGSRIDGLGDRLRSPSPTSDAHEEENWATLLTTIEPGRSSAATSFMSSRPESRSGSNRSSQATTVATSFGEIGGDDTCDLDLPSGITEADVREIRARHGRLRTVSSFPQTDDLVPEGVRRDTEAGRRNDRILELEVFSVILDRMQRREEIPDEWWAAVGLSPDVVRGSA
ncbi:hypothetical protein A1O1_06393 [Capronia coronata CBS 617.96]|uniref:Uncharacterized protein n=1 Tax=Capronia coronata CBS 617.96 TaxID=1182541 RepID=W9YUR5_9EURO|nr:uncharacterized protein A1O1_06393 [Capronia coronata CBS 617.96]EXJ86024.1 hypothetical protein A1O1_06393 [Capronia coronata CBS 617.96]